MTRRSLALASSFVLCNMLITAALAQDSNEQTTGHSFFGNWFGWGGDSAQSKPKSEQGNNPNQQSIRYGQPGSAHGAQQQGRKLESDQVPPDPAYSETGSLPGLGGSPLPRNGVQKGGSATVSDRTSPNGARTGQANATPRYGTPNQPVRRSARQLEVSAPTGEPAVPPASTSANGGIRQSPSRRNAPHMGAENLRNELSGSFDNSASEPTARTARANSHATESSEGAPAEPLTNRGIGTNGTPSARALQAMPFNKQANPITNRATLPIDDHQLDPHTAGAEPRSAAEAFGGAKDARSSQGSSAFVRTPNMETVPAGPQTVRGKEAFGEALQVASGGDPSVLASNQTPVLNADIRGPKQILIGREALYRVRLQNQSDMPAEGIIATVRIPNGCDVMNASPTQGTVQQSQDAAAKGQIQWQLSRLDRRAGETLELRLVPRESRPLELGVTWTVAPVGSRAVVEVQEPKLQLEVAGPNEVYYDKPQVFKLTISNPGTGPAENVKIELLPPGSGKDAVSKETATSHPLGDLPPGGTQTVEVELTAREAGKLYVKAMASAEGGLVCNASKEVFCRKPELEVDWRGPTMKYAGTLATYFIRVRNPGTAPADDVTVRASLPPGAEFTSASEGQMFDTKLREIAWHVGTLRPGDDNYMEVKCVLKTAGANQLKISAATASGVLSDTKTAATNVVALADLKLDVSDPNGPVAVGTTAVYEIHIKNRGANTAKDVNVLGLFSEGIEPEQAEGAMYTVADGRVSFRTINELPAARDIVLRIRAHAVKPGTHIFRAEVLCRDLDIKLAAESTTRFYNDEVTPDGSKVEKQAASRSDAFQSKLR